MIKVFLKGPLLTRSGYGEQARFALRSLRSRPDLFDIYIQPLSWGRTSWMFESDEERSWIDSTIEKTIIHAQNGGTFDVSVQVTIPTEWEKIAPVNIGYTAGIETTKVSAEWIDKGNQMDKIILISEHAKQSFVDTVYHATHNETQQPVEFRLTTPVEVVGYPVKKHENIPNLDLDLSTDFNFLAIAQMGPRKNIENTLKWFVEEFKDDNVGLVLKTNIAKNCFMDRKFTLRNIENIIGKDEDRKCKVYLLHGDMTEEELHALYVHPKIDAFLTLTHGEGFGLPIFEAAYSGLPIVACGWSGQGDYLYDEDRKPQFYEVSYDLLPIPESAVWENILIKESMWSYPREISAREQMRKCFEDLTSKKKTKVLKQAKEFAKNLADKYAPDTLYSSFVGAFYEDDGSDSVEVEDIPKISLVTSVYKADDYIEQLMEDITRQTIFEDKCEWIILNANPPGEEFDEQVILEYAKKYPNNIIYKRLEVDPGIYDTWNMGIKMATGEYVTNVNCDDRRAPWGLEKQARLLAANEDVDLVYNDSYVTHAPNIMWEDVPPNTQRYNFEQFSKEDMLRANLPHNNPMWRKSLHDKFGYFNQHYKSAGDWDFWLRCAFGGAIYKKHPEVLGVYYFNPTGMSTNPEHDSWKREHEKEIFLNYKQQYEIDQQATSGGLIL